MNLDTKLFYQCVRYELVTDVDYDDHYWETMFKDLPQDSKFVMKLSQRMGSDTFAGRNEGVWSVPWPMARIPDFMMPEYDPDFKLTFSEVMDRRALEIKHRINKGERFIVMWSGGMDSTAIMVSLIRNLSAEEQKSIAVNCSVHSLLENHDFYSKFIHGKFKVFDSSVTRYDSLILDDWVPITGDEGDSIFGTHMGLQMYHTYDNLIRDFSPDVKSNLLAIKNKMSDGDIHFSNYKEILIKYLAGKAQGIEFGRQLYSKIVHNINTQKVPVHSLHDFFWWIIFNMKYLHCAFRCSMFYNNSIPVRQALDKSVNWFNGSEIQQWSMVNNNVGTKIRDSIKSYKFVQRQYIHDLTKNDWQLHFKTKLESLNNLIQYGDIHPMAIDENYNKIYRVPEVEGYYKHHLGNYKIDWPLE